MKTEIYYFSGTGNSLAAARAIAAKTGAVLISIPSVIDRESIMTAAGQIGLVFPSYLAQCFGVPFIVERFSIRVDGNCIGCGICAKICPVRNIELRDGRPVWLPHCEMCFACDEWCPAGATHHWGRAEGIKHRHPGAKIADMLGCG